MQLNLDTGSDLIWTQCKPCPSCFDQPQPYFDASLSSTSAVLHCTSWPCQQLPLSSCGTGHAAHGWGNGTCVYTYSYGDSSVTTGIMGADTFTFPGAAAAVPGLAYGRGLFNNGNFNYNSTGSGLAGFGRGALSLPSQLKVDNFSYCFTDVTGSAPSPVLLGLPANLYRGAVQTTRLIQNPARPTLYYLPLKGIAVGSTWLPVPESAFAVAGNGTGGTIIDSGTSVTMLPPPVYGLLRDAFVSQVNLPVTNDQPLCFAVPPSSSRAKPRRVPKLVLYFDGAKLDLPRKNYVFDSEDDGDSNMCIAVAEGGDTTIIGNYQQQNTHILYDLAGNKLSFVPAQCDKV